MGGLSPVHLILLMAVALIVFGPKKLPEIGRGIGQALREFTKAKNDFMGTIQSEMDQVEHTFKDTLPRVTENTYSTSQQAQPLGVPGAVPRTAAAPMVADSPDALPYGGDFHAAEGESQLAFRTAQPDPAAALAAVPAGTQQGTQLAGNQLVSSGHPPSDAGAGANAGKA